MTQSIAYLLTAAIFLSAGYYKSNPKLLINIGWIAMAASILSILQDIWRAL